jgi:hypothetical protein
MLAALFQAVGHRCAEASLITAQAFVDAGSRLGGHLMHGRLLNSSRDDLRIRTDTALGALADITIEDKPASAEGRPLTEPIE